MEHSSELAFMPFYVEEDIGVEIYTRSLALLYAPDSVNCERGPYHATFELVFSHYGSAVWFADKLTRFDLSQSYSRTATDKHNWQKEGF
jgi:hypothetical protein